MAATMQFGALLKRAQLRTGLSQTILADEISELTGQYFSQQKFSNWCTGKNEPEDRAALLPVLHVLLRHEGLTSQSEINYLLETGGEGALQQSELERWFPSLLNRNGADAHNDGQNGNRGDKESGGTQHNPSENGAAHEAKGARHLDDNEGPPEDTDQTSTPPPEPQPWYTVFFAGVTRSQPPTDALEHEQHPPLHWTTRLLNSVGDLSNNWSSERVLLATAWVAVWLATWCLTFPLLRWPYANQAQAWAAMVVYVGATLFLPACIGGLTGTRKDAFWLEQEEVSGRALRVFTHLGAFVGFHVGYTVVAICVLIGYHVGFSPVPDLLEAVLAVVPVLVAYAAARQVPQNNLKAFGTLELTEGDLAMVLAFLSFGPLLGGLVYAFHSWLLTDLGLLPILLAVGALATLMFWHKRRGEDVIPAHTWAAIFGTMLVIQQMEVGQDWFSITVSTVFIAAVVILFARGRFHLSLIGGLGLLLVLGVLWLALQANLWLGRALTVGAVLAWVRWGKRYVWFSFSFWGVILTTVLYELLWRQGIWPEALALTVFTTTIILILWFDNWFDKRRPPENRLPS